MQILRNITVNPIKIIARAKIAKIDEIKGIISFPLYLKSIRLIRLHVNNGENWFITKLMDSCHIRPSLIFSFRFIKNSENFDENQRTIKIFQAIMNKMTKTNEDPEFLTNYLD